ncbi:MAG: carboxypeptidase regulatory-like domain-containing protein, partial [Betaproteobacteria bacterium]|nr:carboxypeptidase regulatory-like domain-containing protein [Betaproteobacteria bacterium]
MENIRNYLRAILGRVLISFLFLPLASISKAQGVIELSINGEPLVEKKVIDYIDNNRKYTTDSMGRLQTEGSCPAIQYTNNSGIEFRMLQFCGVSTEVPIYKFELTEVVTLSGRIETDQLCLCVTSFVNLETGLSYSTGNGLFVNKFHNFSEKLPSGPYRIVVESNTWPTPSEDDYVIASIGVDAREGSVENIKLEISETVSNRFGSVPPRGDLIVVEHKEGEQFSTVQGGPGTASPLVRVSLLNIQTGQATTSMSEQDGSFSIEFFSPPGSYLQVTQDIHAVAYNGFTSSSPGTVIFVPFESQAKNISTAQRLNGSSKTPLAKDLAVKGGYDPGIAWIYGEMDSSNWEAGDAGVITGKIEIFSRNLNENSAIELKNGDAYLELIFSADGEQTAAAPENSSSDMTVTGLPIDRSEPIWAEGMAIGSIALSNYRFIEDGKGVADWELSYSVPNLAPDGIYQLILSGQGWSMNPIIAGLDSENLYYENVFGEPSFHLSTIHGAARITIGEVERPRLYSALLMNSFSNGSRGVVAAEDKEKFGISGRLVTNADSLIISPSGISDTNAITYNIEPFIPLTAYSNKEWISNPKVPFEFSSGSLKATLKSPDGSSLEIGPYPILGSYLQKAASAVGEDLHRNSNAPDLHYGLTTYRDEFNVALNQYGDYEIVLDGEIEDIYGLRLDINGTYSISVAETLDFETGVFPGTPFEVGNQFSSSIVVQPGVPADVSIEITHYPYSAKSNVVTSKYEGSANRYGYYASTEPPFQFDSPGEYKVSYELSYLDSTGKLW